MGKLFKVIWDKVACQFMAVLALGKSVLNINIISNNLCLFSKSYYKFTLLTIFILGSINTNIAYATTGNIPSSGKQTSGFVIREQDYGLIIGNGEVNTGVVVADTGSNRDTILMRNGNAVVVGMDANAYGVSAVNIGGGRSEGNFATSYSWGYAIGHYTSVMSNSSAAGNYNFAVGNSTISGASKYGIGSTTKLADLTATDKSTYSVALANSKVYAQEGGIAISSAYVEGNQSIAIGFNSKSSKDNAVALGSAANVSVANSVALGANSVANTAATGTNSVTISNNNITYSKFAGTSPTGTVSIGASGKERTITNVAAGRVTDTSTDAINGSQLYAVANTAANIANSVKTVLGGNAALESDGKITMSNIGGTGKSTVDEAIKAAKTEVKQGTNTVVKSETTTDDGHTIYTVHANASKVSANTSNLTVTTTSTTDANDVTTTDYKIDFSNSVQATLNQVTTNTNNIQTLQTKVEKNISDIANNTTNISNNTTDIANNKVAIDTLQKGWNLTSVNASGKTNQNIKAGDTVTVNQGKNISLTQSGSTITVATTDDVTFTNVITDTLKTNTSINVGDKVKITSSGIDAGNVKITNVATGTEGTDAVNYSQLESVKNTAENANKGWKLLASTDGNGTEQQIAPDAQVTLKGSNNGIIISQTGTTVTFGLANSVLIGGDKKVTIDGNAGTITGLTNTTWSGTATSGQAATEDQLANAISQVNSTISTSSWKLQGNGTEVATVKSNDKVNFVNGTGTTVTVSADDSNNNTSVKYDITTSTLTVSTDTTNGGVSTITAGTSDNAFATATDVAQTIKTAVDSVRNTVSAPTDGAVSVTSTVSDDGHVNYEVDLAQEIKNKIDDTATKADTNATNIADLQKGWNLTTSGNATDISNETIKAGNTVTIDGGENISLTQDGSKITIATKDEVSFTKVTTDTLKTNTSINVGDKVKITSSGIDAGNVKITNVGAGTDTNDAVNYGQLQDAVSKLNTSISNAGKWTLKTNNADAQTITSASTVNFANGKGTTVNSTTTDTTTSISFDVNKTTLTTTTDGTVNADETGDNFVTADNIASTINQVRESLINKGLTFVGDNSDVKVTRKLGEELLITGGVTDSTELSDKNIGVVSNGEDTLTIKLAKELTNLTSAEFTDGDNFILIDPLSISVTDVDGKTAIYSAEHTLYIDPESDNSPVSLSAKGLDNGGNKITNVADGIALTDAVNVSQLKALEQKQQELVNNPLTFAGDTGSNVTRKLGDILNIKGGQTDDSLLTDKNIGVVAVGDNTLEVKLSKNLTGLHSAEFEDPSDNTTEITGSSIMMSDSTGNKIALRTVEKTIFMGGPNGAVSLSNEGLDNGNNKIINVADGTATTDAVNYGQLQDAVKNLNDNIANAGKWNLQVNDDNDNKQEITSAKTVNFVDGQGTTVVMDTSNSETPVISVNINEATLSVDTNGDVVSSTTAGDKSYTTAVNVAKVINNIADNIINKGTAYSGDVLDPDEAKDDSNTLTNVFTQALGKETKIVGGQTDITKLSDNNIGVVSNGKDTLTIKLAKELTNLTSASFVDDGNNITEIEARGLAVGDNQNNTAYYTSQGLYTGNTDSGNAVSLTADGGLRLIDGATGNEVTLSAASGLDNGGNKITNVAAGTADTDAVNVSQLKALEQKQQELANNPLIFAGDTGSSVTSKLGETLNIKGGQTDITKLSDNNIGVVADGENTLEVKLSKDLTDLRSAEFKDDNGNTTIIDGEFITMEDAQGNVAYRSAQETSFIGPNGTLVSLSGEGLNNGGNKITGVAVGDISAGSTDAVNGGQLYALKDELQANVTNITNNYNQLIGTDNPDGKIEIRNADGTTKQITAQEALTTYDAIGRTTHDHNNIVSAIYHMNTKGIKFFHVNDGTNTAQGLGKTTDDSNAEGEFSTAIGFAAEAKGESAVVLGANSKANGDQSVAIGNGSEALGTQSIAIGTGNQVTGNHSGAIGDPNIVSGEGSYALGNDNTITTDNTFVVGSNVTETVDNSVFLGNESSSTGVRTGSYGLNPQVAGIPNGENGVVSVGSEGQERQIQHVAAGVVSENSTDAINGSQLYGTNQQVINNANAINHLAGEMNSMNKDLRGGIAGSMAMAGLYQATHPGKSMVSAGVGTYKGQSAIALGYSRLSDNGKVGIKFSVNANSRGDNGAAASIGYQW